MVYFLSPVLFSSLAEVPHYLFLVLFFLRRHFITCYNYSFERESTIQYNNLLILPKGFFRINLQHDY